MGFFEFATVAIVFGSGAAVAITAINRFFDARSRPRERELKLAEERASRQELRIAELARQNEQLHDQLAWNTKLLESQDRLMKQLDPKAPSERKASPKRPALT